MNVVDSSISINATQFIDMLEWIMLSNESTCCFYFLPIFQVQISRCLLLTPQKISCNICYFHCGFLRITHCNKKYLIKRLYNLFHFHTFTTLSFLSKNIFNRKLYNLFFFIEVQLIYSFFYLVIQYWIRMHHLKTKENNEEYEILFVIIQR